MARCRSSSEAKSRGLGMGKETARLSAVPAIRHPVLDHFRRPTWPCGSPLRQRRRAGVRRDGGRCGTERRER
eukprot:scaffold437_cov122-Isochrysis_galbana.AAC.7